MWDDFMGIVRAVKHFWSWNGGSLVLFLVIIGTIIAAFAGY